MAAAWQASGTLLFAATPEITPVIPTHQTDDTMVCGTASRDTSLTCATPSGWTLLYGPADETAWRSYFFWRRATSGAQTNPLCEWGASGTDLYAQIHTIRGASTTGDPFAASAQTDGSADPAAATGVTTTVASQLVVVVGIGADNLQSTVAVTGTDPTTYTSRHYSEITGGADACGWFATATRASAGATGTVSNDFDANPLHWSIVVAAVLDVGGPIPELLMAPRLPA